MAWVKKTSMSPPIGVTADDGTNSSSKTIDFDTDIHPLVNTTYVEIIAIFVTYVATATAGTRQIAVDVIDSDDDLRLRIASATTVTASLTKSITFAQGVQSAPAVAGLTHGHDPLPLGLFLGPGMKLRVSDVAAVAAGADDVTVSVFYR